MHSLDPSFRRSRSFASLVALGVFALGATALAQTAPPRAPARGEAEATRPVVVVVHADASLSPERVRAAIASELGAPAIAPEDAASAGARGTVTITWRSASRELAVTYSEPARGTVSRVVPAPADAAEVPSLAALLAGNMVRHEADELLGAPPPAAQPPPIASPWVAPPAAPLPPYQPANATFFHPFGTSYGKPDIRTSFDFNLLYGRIAQLDGLEIGTVSVVTGDVSGAQLALGANLVRGRTQGLQIAGVYNEARGGFEGLQLAFAGNRAAGGASGIAGAFGFNFADDAVAGAQASLGFNYAGGTMRGLQGALGFNYVGDHSGGAQLALGANVAGADHVGVQAALGFNDADDVRGGQIGAVNVARRVKGFQLGLVNVADDVDGVPIGLVSVTKTGGVHPSAWASNTALGNVGLKFATRYTYTMISGSAHDDGTHTLFGPGFTLGGHVPIESAFFDFDVGGTHLFGGKLTAPNVPRGAAIARSNDETLLKVRAMLGYSFAKHLSVYAGAGVTLKVRYPVETATQASPTATLGPEYFAGIQF